MRVFCHSLSVATMCLSLYKDVASYLSTVGSYISYLRREWPQSSFTIIAGVIVCCASLLRDFYRAMLCIRGTSHGSVSVCPSVCPSVTSRSYTKTAKRRITQSTSHDSPGTLVFRRQRSPRNSTGITPYGGAKCRWGGSKSATFNK